VSDWKFADRDPADQLAKLHYFSMTKVQEDGEFEFIITVREYVTPMDPAMPFYAVADKQINQHVVAITPFGWGATLLEALSRCMDAIRQFPYQGGA